MGLSVADIVAKFPVKTLPIITGEPNYATIGQIIQTLYGNAASLPTTTGGGAHGHIGLIMTTVLYATLTPMAYTVPDDPGPVITHTANASPSIRERNTITYKEARRIYDNNANMDAALKTQIMDAIEDSYLCELRNKYTGYFGVTARDLIDHLLDRYGNITPADIAACKQRINKPIDASQPIDVYFQKIDNGIQYAGDGQVAFTTGQILQTTYHAISTSGFYNDACKEWRKKPPADKNWWNFKRFFAAEYRDLQEQQKVNVSQNNFQGANSAINLMMALDHLALAATTDREVVHLLAQANERLTITNKTLTEQIQQLLKTNATLVNKMGSTDTTPPPSTGTNGCQPFDKAAREAKLDPKGHCWTHGYRVLLGHNSTNCKGKLGGHKDAVTRDNNMGGSEKGKG
jgi:hypothetical protein